MLSLSFAEFKALAQKGNVIPLYEDIPADLDTPVSALMKIRTGNHDFLLESVVGGEKWGRYSFLGGSPKAVFRSRGQQLEIIEGKKKTKSQVADPFQSLKNYLSRFRFVPVPDLPRFTGGAVGFLAYDMVRFFERLPSTAKDELGVYDSYFLITDTVVIFDNLKQVIRVVANVHVEDPKAIKKSYDAAKAKISNLIAKLKRPVPSKALAQAFAPRKKGLSGPLKVAHSEAKFCALVEKAKEYVKAGDIFQMQLSTRFEGKTRVDPLELYRAIRRLNPSPYLYYLSFDDLSIVGASPELMVRVDGEKVEVRPIAGTRRRGRDAEDEKRMEKELRSDPKELAEHVMLVDLGRNDLGRVCESGSVRVDELEVVEKYSHVMHLVSHVSGKLKKGRDAFDVVRATFPAGTLTGAPKIRAMEIIEELEGRRRGIYGGAVGYIGFDGNLDMAITIRTALFHKGKIYIQAAGGIVYDSIPKQEYLECQNKAKAMIRALESLG